MKKNVLALSIAAMIGGLGFAGAASAVVLNGGLGMTASTATVMEESISGVGHSLYVPYFNVQDGNMTVLHVVNTDQTRGKAVKVRFRGAANSDDLFDFQVYMSPGDVWTAAISAGADGIAQIVTADNTCTVPALTSGVNQAFFTNRLSPQLTAAGKAAQTREGYVEIFNMADIPKPAVLAGSLYESIKHVNNVAPCSVSPSTARTKLNTVATTDFGADAAGSPVAPAISEPLAAAAGFDTPTGGLMGDWYIINVPNTTTFSGAATAVVAKVAAGGASGIANFVHFPQSDTAVVGDINNYTADPLLRGPTPIVVAGNYDLPDMSTPYVSAVTDPLAQATSLTAALAVKSITNEYANDAGIAAKTDWLFSMPTRRYSVAANYAVLPVGGIYPSAYRVFSTLGQAWFTETNTLVDADGKICVKAESQTFYNREETTPGATTPGPVFSPSTPGVTPVVQFCGETSVLSFADAGNSVMAATVARQNLVSGTYTNGWGTIATNNAGAGLPIVGSAFIKLSNGAATAGTSGTYGINWPHRFTK